MRLPGPWGSGGPERLGWARGVRWLAALGLVVGWTAAATAAADVRHYVFFGSERDRLTEAAFIDTPALEGAQLKYTWRELEPEKEHYHFEAIEADLAYLTARGKRLFVQLQETSFDPERKLVPKYLLNESRYHGGVNLQYSFQGERDEGAAPAGWVARRWDPAVRRRFHRLLEALGRQFDGRIEGLNLPETAVDFGETGRYYPPGFTPRRYRDAVLANVAALHHAFRRSVGLQYANFMPGEWLPQNDHGFLRSVFDRARRLGVGLGAPDLLPFRPAQLHHAYPLIRASAGRVPTAIAVQDGNLAAISPGTRQPVSAAELARFAAEDLQVTYLFWGTEQPYFTAQVVPLLRGQAGRTNADANANASGAAEPVTWTTQQDHQNMKEQLGIVRLRPGPSGREGATNSANYDPARANPFPDVPEVLTLRNGQKVTTADIWWRVRRPEIVEDLEREVYGRVPAQVPAVTWSVRTQATDRVVGKLPVNARQLVGHVDNAACPSVEVNLQVTLVTPKDAPGRVPVLILFGGFGGSGFPRRVDEPEPTNRFTGFGGVTFADPPSTEQLIAAGWGYATLVPGSVQADDGAGLTRGIIGLVNRGRPRKPDDWGALRAWAWGAARVLDYLETDPTVDARRVGIEGVSRFGKAALVTLAFERRFAVALVGSSGAGGAKLFRRNFGEAVENLTGSGEYHWMAGNFLKYGTAEGSLGRRDAGDLPVDAHELIALCAPRPVFISYGIPAKGDARWLDQQGSFMAAVAAGPVFRLLGARDLGVTEDYRQAAMPPVNTGLLDGDLAWRQHDGGHEDRSNMRFFLSWARRVWAGR